MDKHGDVEKFKKEHCSRCCYQDKCFGKTNDCIMTGHYIYYGIDKNGMKVLGLKVSGIGDKKFFLKLEETFESWKLK